MTAKKGQTRRKLLQWLIIISLLFGIALYAGCGIYMPGKSHRGALPPISPQQETVEQELRRVVTTLAEEHLDRHTSHPKKLAAAADWVQSEFETLGYAVTRQTYDVRGVSCDNLIAEIKGSEEIVVLGAHYDAFPETPGANDNASGVAALLSIARYFKDKQPTRTIRFVAFTNEEPPHFNSPYMGSLVYAKQCRANNDQIIAMFSLETMGYYTDEPESQNYPRTVAWLYPSTGNFVGFVGNKESRKLAERTVKLFRKSVAFPSQGAALPERMVGVGFSDQRSFWANDYPGLMITDTAFFRYDHYHTPEDTPDKLNFPHFARVVEGLQRVFEQIAE